MFTDMEKWAEIRRRVLVDGLSKRAACRQYDVHWDTLAKILEHPGPPGGRRAAPRPRPKLGPFLPVIHQILEDDRKAPRKQRHTANRIFQRPRTEYGYTGGKTVVQAAVAAWKARAAEVFVPLAHPPGEAQVGFGEAEVTLDGRPTQVARFVLTRPYSDAIFVRAFPRECTEAFLEGHARAFESLGGVPRRISYDDLKIAVARITGGRGRAVTREFQENALLIGGSGTGKTHLATALGMEACARGKRVRFYRVTELATQLLEAREERQLGRLRSRLAKLGLLVLDELGYVPASQVGAELLFDVISTAYERSSVVVTSNLPFEEWEEVLGSERLTGATLDRLTHRCTIIETGRESYRLREARRRRGAEARRRQSPADVGPVEQ